MNACIIMYTHCHAPNTQYVQTYKYSPTYTYKDAQKQICTCLSYSTYIYIHMHEYTQYLSTKHKHRGTHKNTSISTPSYIHACILEYFNMEKSQPHDREKKKAGVNNLVTKPVTAKQCF